MTTRPKSLIRELWQHRRLAAQMTSRGVELRHKGSFLGFAWSILNPLLMLGVYVIVFGYIFGGFFAEDPVNTKASYALTIFLGLSIFHFIAEVNALAPGAVGNSPNFVKKVVFPLPILPLSVVGGALFNFTISLVMVIVAAQMLDVPVLGHLGWFVILIAPAILLAMGLALALAALGVFIKDITQITQFFNLVLLYSSAVFFSVQEIPALGWKILRFNPVLQIINETRRVVFWDQSVDYTKLAWMYGVGFVALGLGAWIFNKLRNGFADAL